VRNPITIAISATAAALLSACLGGGGGGDGGAASASSASTATAGPNGAVLEWNANTESDMSGYRVYRSMTTGQYGAPVAVVSRTSTSVVIDNLQPGTHYFVITAVDGAGNESARSDEVSKTIQP
jgi:fibronectin type 3 domain-containing protein